MPMQATYAVFDVVEAAPLPETIGNLLVGSWAGRRVALSNDSACSSERSANVLDVSVDITENVWADALAFRTFVDGESYRMSSHENYGAAYGHSWTGHGADTLVDGCGGYPLYVAAGGHTVRMEAVVAGSDQVVSTPSADFSLSCDDASSSSCSASPQPATGGPWAWLALMGLSLLRRRKP